MAWVRCCGGKPTIKPVAVVLGGRLQSGFSLSGSGLSQQTSSIKVTRGSGVNGGTINLNASYTGYSKVQIVAGSVTPAGVAYLRIQVAGKNVDLSTNQTKTITLNPDTDVFNAISCSMFNNDGTGYITDITLLP